MTKEERDQLNLIIQELESQGVASAKVKDGQVFFFKRAVIEELYEKLQANPKTKEIQLFICSDPKKVTAKRIPKARA